MGMSATPISMPGPDVAWELPSRGRVGMVSLIIAEVAIFVIFVVAYLYYSGKSLTGPVPKDVLQTPVFYTVCLLSSSLTIHFAVRAIWRGSVRTFRNWWFGTTYYSLVGLHAFHVTVGLILLSAVLTFTLLGHVGQGHAYRLDVLSIYWHFVDAVWVVVFTVVYIIGR